MGERLHPDEDEQVIAEAVAETVALRELGLPDVYASLFGAMVAKSAWEQRTGQSPILLLDEQSIGEDQRIAKVVRKLI